ncbi:MAG: DUF4231 domain-containing protein [Symploca sp. SIO2E6]|nr:DUF4231 domain-containing protein [Symploca sp. SIO2E6]
MAKNYQEEYKQKFIELIDQLELPEINKQFMKSRWLDQLLWLESRSGGAKRWSTRLRLATIVGGVLIPALVSLNFNDNQLGETIGWVTFGLSQVVAISAAVEEYFHFSDKSTQYRQTAECLKSEAWQFFQLSGIYQKYPNHLKAYPNFAVRVEQFIQKDVQTFVEIAKEQEKEEQLLQKDVPNLVERATDKVKEQQPTKQGQPSPVTTAVPTSKTPKVPLSKSDADLESKEEDD